MSSRKISTLKQNQTEIYAYNQTEGAYFTEIESPESVKFSSKQKLFTPLLPSPNSPQVNISIASTTKVQKQINKQMAALTKTYKAEDNANLRRVTV